MNRRTLLGAGPTAPLETMDTIKNRLPFPLTKERKKMIDFSHSCGVIQIVVVEPKATAIKDHAKLARKHVGICKDDTAPKTTFGERIDVTLANGKLNDIHKHGNGVALPEQMPA